MWIFPINQLVFNQILKTWSISLAVTADSKSLQYLPERYGKPLMLIICLILSKNPELTQKWLLYIFETKFGPILTPNLV